MADTPWRPGDEAIRGTRGRRVIVESVERYGLRPVAIVRYPETGATATVYADELSPTQPNERKP